MSDWRAGDSELRSSQAISRWSEELAREPGSLVFLQLGEALRRRGQIDLAERIALRGLERHSHRADAHELLARIYVDRGELERAFDEWDTALRLAPDSASALRGMGSVRFQQGHVEEAARYLRRAGGHTPPGPAPAATGSPAVVSGKPASPASPATPALAVTPHDAGATGDQTEPFERVLRAMLPEAAAMLLDPDGLVLAGHYASADGHDVAAQVGAELSGVTDEARRATKHLTLGEWHAIVIETETSVVALAPTEGDGLLVLAAPIAAPLGLVRRVLDRCVDRARAWLRAEGTR